IARSDHDAGHAVTTVVVELRDDRHPGLVGLGEGYPDRFYGETPETMLAVFPRLLAAVEAPDWTAAGLTEAGMAMDRAIAHHGGAKCAIDIALHDLAGKIVGQPVHLLLGLSAEIPPTDFTLGIDEPAVVAERARRANRFPALKIKVGGPDDLATLEGLGVELIEQPFPRQALRDLGWLQERSTLPIVADESAVTIEDLDGLVGVVAGVNVKLAKCGGVGLAGRMLA